VFSQLPCPSTSAPHTVMYTPRVRRKANGGACHVTGAAGRYRSSTSSRQAHKKRTRLGANPRANPPSLPSKDSLPSLPRNVDEGATTASARQCQVKSSQVKVSNVKTCRHAKSSQVKSSQVKSSHANVKSSHGLRTSRETRRGGHPAWRQLTRSLTPLQVWS